MKVIPYTILIVFIITLGLIANISCGIEEKHYTIDQTVESTESNDFIIVTKVLALYSQEDRVMYRHAKAINIDMSKEEIETHKRTELKKAKVILEKLELIY